MRSTMSMLARRCLGLLSLAVVSLSTVTCIKAQSPSQAIVVRRADGDSVTLDSLAMARLSRVSRSASEHGQSSRFSGVTLQAVLGAAGVRLDTLRGPALREVVLVTARDGYVVAFSAAELSHSLGAREVLVVNERDGAPLPDTQGPWRLVVPDDKRPARWIRQIRRIEVRR
jgi:hypothetical protein